MEPLDYIKFKKEIFRTLDREARGEVDLDFSFGGLDYSLTVDYDYDEETAYTGVEHMGRYESYIRFARRNFKVLDARCYEGDEPASSDVMEALLREDIIFEI